MNTYYVNDNNFKNSDIYKEFLKENLGSGNLKVRAYAASGAIPIKGVNVEVSTNYNGDKIVFFDGATDESGIIENIVLPAPVLDENNLVSPYKRVYEIKATYLPDNASKIFKINIYEGVCVIQNIKIIPDMNMGDISGS